MACNNPFLQDPLTQKYILLQLLCSAASSLGAPVTCTDEALKTAAAEWLCQQSPEKLRLLQMQNICDSGLDINCAQPVCWSPLELEGAMTYVIDQLTTALAPA